MPRLVNLETRATIELHAPWWSSATIPTAEPVEQLIATGLAPEDDTDEDDDEAEVGSDQPKYAWDRRVSTQRFKERIVIYADYLDSDDEAINKQIYAKMKFKRSRMKPNTDDIARIRGFTLRQFVVELTDETGRVLDFRNGKGVLMGRDAEFVMDAIGYLKEPPVPVIEADREEAARNLKRGETAASHTEPIQIAARSFRQNDEGDLSW